MNTTNHTKSPRSRKTKVAEAIDVQAVEVEPAASSSFDDLMGSLNRWLEEQGVASPQRMLVANVAWFISCCGTAYVLGSWINILVLAVVSLTGPGFLAFMTTCVAMIIVFFSSIKVADFVHSQVLKFDADAAKATAKAHISTVKAHASSVKSWFVNRFEAITA